MKVGDIIEAEHDGELGTGIVTAVRDGRALVQLTIRSARPWVSPITGGTVPAGCPRSYLLWFALADLSAATPGRLPAQPPSA